jgi:hypothetical protein
MTSMVIAHISCGRVPQALFETLEPPERQEWAYSGVSQETRGQGHRPKLVKYLTGAIHVYSVLKLLTSGETRASLAKLRKGRCL